MDISYCNQAIERGAEVHTMHVIALWVAVDIILGVTDLILRRR